MAKNGPRIARPGGVWYAGSLRECPCGALWRRSVKMRYDGPLCQDCRKRKQPDKRKKPATEDLDFD